VKNLMRAAPKAKNELEIAEKTAPGILKWLGNWFRGGVLSKDDLAASRALARDGDGLLASISGAEENVRKSLVSMLRPKIDYFSQQMTQIQRSASKFEAEAAKHASDASGAQSIAVGYAENLKKIEQAMRDTLPGHPDFKGLMELKLKTQQAVYAAKADAATAIAKSGAASDKAVYVNRLADDLKGVDDLLDHGGLPEAVNKLKQLNVEYAQHGESVFTDMPLIKDWMNKTMANVNKAPDMLRGLSLKSQNLEAKLLTGNKAFVKEMVRMMEKSPETRDAWKANPANAAKIQQLMDELPAGSKLLRWMKESKKVLDGEKTAAQIVGRSPQELAQMMKIPAIGAAATAAVVIPAVTVFSHFRNEIPHLACEEAPNIAADLTKLGATGPAAAVVQKLAPALDSVFKLSQRIETQFAQDPKTTLEVTLPQLGSAIQSLYQLRNQLVSARNNCQNKQLVDSVSVRIDSMVNDFSTRLDDFSSKIGQAQ
jgi:hypothetical protein